MEIIDANTKFEDIEITDYPYIGIGKKPFPKKRKIISDDELEKIIGG
jgi:bacteriocin-like protein